MSPEIDSLKKMIRRYGELSTTCGVKSVILTQVGKDLCLAHAIAQLPDQPRVYAEHLARYQNLFEDGVFGPTGETEEIYKQVPPHADTCSFKDMPRQDYLTERLIKNLKRLDRKVVDPARRRWKKRRNDPENPQPQRSVELETIRTIMNILVGIYAPILLTASMATLYCIRPMAVRIGMLGVLGMVLSISLIFLVEDLKRSELFSILAGYFAVLGVFIGATSGNSMAR